MIRSFNWVLILVGAVLILLEVLLGAITGFDLLLLGSAILLGGVIGLIAGSTPVGIAAAGILSVVYLLVGRRRIRKRLLRPGLASNTDALIGRTVRVVETITPDRAGRVKYEGDEWRAVADTAQEGAIEAGRTARVSRIDGVTLVVVAAGAEGAAGGPKP